MSKRSGTPARTAPRRWLVAAVGAALVCGAQGGFGALAVAAAAASPAAGRPNRADVTAGTRSTNQLPAPPGPIAGPRPPDGPLRVPKVPMQPALVGLDPVAGAHFVGSDGVLELSAPAGAVSAADGKLSLLVRQVEPGSGSNAGGSGRVSFGTWLVQVVDASGRPASRGLRQPLSVKLHESGRAGALDLRHVRVLVNPPLPRWVDLDPSASPTPSPKPALGQMSRQTATLEPGTTTLSASLTLACTSVGGGVGELTATHLGGVDPQSLRSQGPAAAYATPAASALLVSLSWRQDYRLALIRAHSDLRRLRVRTRS